MTQADRVHSTPPTNTSATNPVDPTRRGFITLAAGASIISVGSLAAVAMLVSDAPIDPIFAAIEKHKALTILFDAAWKARGSCRDFGALTEDEKRHIRRLNDAIDEAGLPMEQAACELLATVPTTPAGIVAAIRVIQSHSRDDNEHMPAGEWLYEDEDDARNGRDWLECFLDTIVVAVDEIATRRGLA